MPVKHIAFTVYPAKDVARARKFYEEALGLKVTKDFQGKWVEFHLENGAFALSNMIPQKPTLKDGGSIAFEVDDLKTAVAAAKEKGARVLDDKIESPVCWMAALADTEGNAFVLHQKKG